MKMRASMLTALAFEGVDTKERPTQSEREHVGDSSATLPAPRHNESASFVAYSPLSFFSMLLLSLCRVIHASLFRLALLLPGLDPPVTDALRLYIEKQPTEDTSDITFTEDEPKQDAPAVLMSRTDTHSAARRANTGYGHSDIDLRDVARRPMRPLPARRRTERKEDARELDEECDIAEEDVRSFAVAENICSEDVSFSSHFSIGLGNTESRVETEEYPLRAPLATLSFEPDVLYARPSQQSAWSSDSSVVASEKLDYEGDASDVDAWILKVTGRPLHERMAAPIPSHCSDSDGVPAVPSPHSMSSPELSSSSETDSTHTATHDHDHDYESGSDKENALIDTREDPESVYNSDEENIVPAQRLHVVNSDLYNESAPQPQSLLAKVPFDLRGIPVAPSFSCEVDAPAPQPFTDITSDNDVTRPAPFAAPGQFSFVVEGLHASSLVSLDDRVPNDRAGRPSSMTSNPQPLREFVRLDYGTFEYWPEMRVGKGATSLVFHALEQPICTDGPADSETQFDVALKVVKKTTVYKFTEGRNALIDELMIWRAITESDKPFLNRLLRSFDLGESVVFVSRFYHETLEQRMFYGPELTLDDLTFYYAEMIYALHGLHELGIMHRDIKPGNVLVGPDGHLALTDFGLSYAPQIHEPRTANGYGPTYRVGTPGYWAPEVRAHLPGVWQSSDIFSLAIVFVELALDKGDPFFVGKTEEELDADMDSREIPYHGLARIDVNLADLIERMIGTFKGGRPRRWMTPRLMEHAFFENIDWVALADGRYNPTYRPPIPVPGHEDGVTLDMFHPDTPFEIADLQGDTPSAHKKRQEEEIVKRGLEEDYEQSPFYYTCPDSHLGLARYGW